MSEVALDTSAAIPFLLRSHDAHRAVRRHVGSRRPALTGHSLAETYSVLTRLPGDARVAPGDAVLLLDANFGQTMLLAPETAAGLPAVLAPIGVTGGAVYDALVALAARHAALPLVTRDRRAASTYLALGAGIEFVSP